MTPRWMIGPMVLASIFCATACGEPARSYPHAVGVATGQLVPAVALKAAGGRDFSLVELTGQWVWLYFGYTHCPDVCPTTLAHLAEAHKQLASPERVKVVFVSVDPKRDTPEVLAKHAAFYDPSFLGVTGDVAAIDRLTSALGARYVIGLPVGASGDYPVSHTNTVYVIDPEGHLAAQYDPGTDTTQMAADFNTLTSRDAVVTSR